MSYPDGTEFPVDLLIIPNISAVPGRFTSDELQHIYNEMKNNPSERDFYGKCLSPLQVDFVKHQPEKVKRAIRVIKDWTKQYGHKLPSYATELLVIKSYEDFNRPEPGGITEEKLVTAVFDRLRDCSNIKIHWDTNYKLMDHQQPSGSYIMDPANPYHNLFSKKTEEYWIRHNETENIVLSDPDFSRLERDAARTMQRLQ